MNPFLDGYVRWIRRLLPTPLTIALLLTLITVALVGLISPKEGTSLTFLTQTWVEGLWQSNLLVFAVQMMLMLVLGHTLALTPIISKLIHRIVEPCTTSARSAALVSFFTMLVALFNWGLGLIFGAILARKVGEKAHAEKRTINYALIGAAGYAGLMVWHGGFSGSALIKVAEPLHLANLMGAQFESDLPIAISLSQTVFSNMNITATLAVLIFIPLVLYFIGQRIDGRAVELSPEIGEAESSGNHFGAEKLDHSRIFTAGIGFLILLVCAYEMFIRTGVLDFFNPNNINLLLLGLCLFLHRSISSFTLALEKAMVGASGILIQFPLYFGILALMNESGLISRVAEWFISVSDATTYPLLTFISAGLVNLFVPSGGGQWAIQGPIIIQSSLELGIPLQKSIMALAYGDEITNMLQPFWALPLLGITRLNAKDILPYTLIMFLVGSVIFTLVLLLF